MINYIFRLVSSIFLLILSACGSGSASPYVTDIVASQIIFGQITQFSISGGALDGSVNISAQGCVSEEAVKVESNTRINWRCVVDSVGLGAITVKVHTPTGNVLFTRSFDVTPPVLPVVTSIRVDRLMYSRQSQFTLTGFSLEKDFVVSSKNCKGLSSAALGSTTSRLVTCNINATGAGAVFVEAKLADGTTLKSATFDVPNPQVKMVTSLGSMVLELNPATAPLTTDNFLQYVNSKFYDGTIVHRIVTNNIAIAQGGWLTATPSIKPGQRPAIPLEVGKGLSNLRGTIAMARGSDLNSATSQYYFNLADNSALDNANGGYAVFGKLLNGLEVLDAMLQIKTGAGYGLIDYPLSSIVVDSVLQIQ